MFDLAPTPFYTLTTPPLFMPPHLPSPPHRAPATPLAWPAAPTWLRCHHLLQPPVQGIQLARLALHLVHAPLQLLLIPVGEEAAAPSGVKWSWRRGVEGAQG